MVVLPITSKVYGQSPIKPARAVVYSILLPGLGHRYVNDGNWNHRASLYTIVDALLVTGLASSEWQRRHLVNSYQTWAASNAHISTQGKSRRFYVMIGNYLSSEEYRDVQLRNRRIDLASSVSDPELQWSWSSIEDLQRYRDLRSGSESWSQRRGTLIAALIANRMISGFSALMTARRKQDQIIQVAFTPNPMVQVLITL